MREVVERNLVETLPSVCHPHVVCDVNMVLYEVFLCHGMDTASEGRMGRHDDLWDQA